MTKSLKDVKNEKCSLNVDCRTWNMARKRKIMENEKHSLDDLKNEEITEKCEQ
ncbi:hypothetical protein T4B_13971 [Trichinella pseudospiralis]|uniref:Uncharacterized protein n=1 Tax=Trichinella pseudospiralis TaxID=6337 RepID=A0A0V1GAB6_TRIPS|nr:hypothetical protein T4B_13971 [Trichinella pseudospiralis]